MKIRLLDYADTEHFVEIPDDTEKVVIDVISGDMVLQSPIHYDTSETRCMNFNDGRIHLTKDDFYKLNEVKSSYDLIFSVIFNNNETGIC